MKTIFILLVTMISTPAFAAEWKCGKMQTKKFIFLDSGQGTYLSPANEAVDDFLASTKENDAVCVKGNFLHMVDGSELLIYAAQLK